MKLILVYGPPAAGKLTIANELAKITGFRVFHNHLTIDMVRSIFPRSTPQFQKLINRYRLELMEEAARAGVNFIFTFVYAKSKHDDLFIGEIIRRIRKHGGTVHFVQIKCSYAELAKRVRKPNRKKFAKVSKVSKLKEILREYDVISSVPYRGNLVINNTNLPAKLAARKIVRHFKLPQL
jgi:hypothetical protein